jgi:hypothetical protein
LLLAFFGRFQVKIVSRLLLAGCLVSAITWAQAISTSQLKGTVQDPTGSAVPGADVKVTQTATGANRTVLTGVDGGYLFTELPVGPYQLEVTKQGFSKAVQTGIVLQVASNPTIDVTLKVGAVSEQVLVGAAAAMVETQNTGVGQVIDQQRVIDLPLNGRQVTDLIFLTGSASTGLAFRASYPSSTAVSIAGGGGGTVSYVLDGGTHNDPLSNQNLPLPFPDAIQEFKVETSSLPAQYGYRYRTRTELRVYGKVPGMGLLRARICTRVCNFGDLRHPGDPGPRNDAADRRPRLGGLAGAPTVGTSLMFLRRLARCSSRGFGRAHPWR